MKSLNKLNPMPAQFGKMDDILRRGFAGSGHNHDLQTLIATRTFAAVVVGMAIYTLAEYLIERPADWVGFLTHHLLHVAVIGLAVWLAAVMVISRLVIKPVNHVFIHLRRIASGRLEYLDVEVGSSQLSSVVGSVNALVSRLRRTPEDDSVSRALDHVRELRSALRERMSDSDDTVPIMRLVTKLEGELLEVVQEHTAPACPSSQLQTTM